MGAIIEFASNGETASGYLAEPATDTGIPLVVIQEWWGLVPHITDVCDRFAAEELAVDLRGRGKDIEIVVHPGVDHAFFNDTRPEVYDAAEAGLAWQQTVGFLLTNLG